MLADVEHFESTCCVTDSWTAKALALVCCPIVFMFFKITWCIQSLWKADLMPDRIMSFPALIPGQMDDIWPCVWTYNQQDGRCYHCNVHTANLLHLKVMRSINLCLTLYFGVHFNFSNITVLQLKIFTSFTEWYLSHINNHICDPISIQMLHINNIR